MKLLARISFILGLLIAGIPSTIYAQSNQSSFNGIFKAWQFAYGVNPAVSALQVVSGSSTSGTYTMSLSSGQIALADGTSAFPLSILAPITIGAGAAQETVTPTAVSSACGLPNQQQGACTVTATFANAHGLGDTIRSGSLGLQEALNYASSLLTGGLAGVDSAWQAGGGTNALLTSAVVVKNTAIQDNRSFTPTYWNPGATASTALAVPTTLTATTAAPTSTPTGSYTTGTYHLCISYVDVMGNEGACSADFSEAGVATGSFTFTAPAASSGAVGYTIYISLVSGAYTAMYQVPLTSTICTLTTIETITPACAVSNTTYNQSGATAIVTALTVNTAPLAINSAVIGTSTVVHGNAIAKTTYGYVPSSKLAVSAIPAVYFPATGAAATSTNLDTVASLVVPAGFWQIGKTIRICGQATMSGASTATILGVDLLYDAAGSDSAGAPVIVSTNQLTPASALSASVLQYQFCQTLAATVIGTTVTGGTILAGPGYLSYSQTSAGTVAYTGPGTTVGTTGSINLLGAGRIHVAFVHTTGTDGAATILQGLTVEVL